MKFGKKEGKQVLTRMKSLLKTDFMVSEYCVVNNLSKSMRNI